MTTKIEIDEKEKEKQRVQRDLERKAAIIGFGLWIAVGVISFILFGYLPSSGWRF